MLSRFVAAGLSCLAVLTFSAAPRAADAADPGHALAEKFAKETDGQSAAPKAAASPAFKVAPAPGEAYEKDLLDSARAEAEVHTPAAAPAPAPALTNAAPSPSAAKTAPEAPSQAPATHAATEPAAAPPAAGASAASTKTPAHLTVLLALTAPGAGDGPGKIQSNPILCTDDACYLSSGTAQAAIQMPKADAMSAKTSALGLAGACKGKPDCIFRDVILAPGASLQVVDAGFARKPPFAPFEAKPDPSCDIHDGDLDCNNPVSDQNFQLWLVPEMVAAKASPEQLEDALATGLFEENVARDGDK